MANDWIKMRMDLQTHPKVVRILSATKSDKFRVIGGLHAVWCLFDTHSEDGTLSGYNLDTMDHIIGWEGFSGAVASVGWMIETSEGVVMPSFEEHNGSSAKKRSEDTKRKRESRKSTKCPKVVRKVSEKVKDESTTREEKRREENILLNNLFDRFWDSGIRKTGKKDCLPIFEKIITKQDDSEKFGQFLVDDIKKRIQLNQMGFDQMHPKTYLNGERWTDEYKSSTPPTQKTASIFDLNNKTYASGDL